MVDNEAVTLPNQPIKHTAKPLFANNIAQIYTLKIAYRLNLYATMLQMLIPTTNTNAWSQLDSTIRYHYSMPLQPRTSLYEHRIFTYYYMYQNTIYEPAQALK